MNLQESIQRIREMMGLDNNNPPTGKYEYIGTCMNSFDEYGECIHDAFYDEEHFFHSWENADEISKEEFWSNINPSSEKYDEVKEMEADPEYSAEYRYNQEDDVYFIFVGDDTHYFFVNTDSLDTLHDTEEINEIADNIDNVYSFTYYPPNEPYSSTEYYNFETENEKYVVRFYPSQPRKYYPEGSYTRDYMTNDMMAMSGIEPISDKSMTGENNALKVNATVMAVTIDWFNKHPDFTQLVIEPVDERRLRLVKRFVDNTVGGKYKVSVESMPGLYGNSVIIRNN